MPFKSKLVDSFQVFSVTGTNTCSFAIKASAEARQGLLGFSVERSDANRPRRYMPGFKVFKSLAPKIKPGTYVSTYNYPVQAFVWDDFTGEPDVTYEYTFHPVRGTPSRLDRQATPITIRVRTEQLYSDGEHDVFFNRGVASSQAYARKFGNKRPDKLKSPKKEQALQWLSRDLDDAALKFIATAKKGESLRCCFYEFRYKAVAEALQAAIKRKVDVRIIVDTKANKQSFPKRDNLKMLKAVGIANNHVIKRDANPNNIQHNKFMVLFRHRRPVEVWTGSTNMSDSGFAGQTNVGHWVRNARTAELFSDYWKLLAGNPGARKGDAMTIARQKKAKYRRAVEAITSVPRSQTGIKTGITPLFSPRTSLAALNLYGSLLDSAKVEACITLAFGVNKAFKDVLRKHTKHNDVVFMLLEKKDEPNKRSRQPFVAINAANNVYQAWGSFISDPVYQFAREVNTRKLKLSQHVSYIHCKFLLVDPLSTNPVVVTGSANFSAASTTENDE